jgi:hypothetical protein
MAAGIVQSQVMAGVTGRVETDQSSFTQIEFKAVPCADDPIHVRR